MSVQGQRAYNNTRALMYNNIHYQRYKEKKGDDLNGIYFNVIG